VDSTQDLAICLTQEKLEGLHGTVIIAERQKKGKGRIGRRWISPKGGVWLSVILKPKIKAAQGTLLPFVAALAVCDAINRKTKLNSKVKWPNDIVIEGRKVSGILVDMSIENENIEYAVVGIGINANFDVSRITRRINTNNPSGMFEITSLKSELSGKDVNITDLIQLLLEKLEYYYIQLEKNCLNTIIQKCRDTSDTLNNLVIVKHENVTFEGIAVDIDIDGALLIRKSDNRIHRVVAGDVLVRRK
jgi:BirA family biotin operon repressor/biotin-[acetyl-CoA-carboxylase] ligase